MLDKLTDAVDNKKVFAALLSFQSICLSRKLFIAKQNIYGSSFPVLKLQRQGFENCQVIASDKSNLLRKVDFLLKSGFQVIIVVNFV